MAETRVSPDAAAPDDLTALPLAQARLLIQRTRSSCLIVEGVIVYLTALVLFAGDYAYAALWFILTSAMVAVVALYPRLAAPRGVTEETAARYLRGHTIISGLTGAVWAGLVIGYLDQTSLLRLFIALNMVSSITLGGMLPSAEYRPAFIALITAMVVPVALTWILVLDGPARLVGAGLLIFYGFGILVSARAELQTREALSARRQRQLSEGLRVKTEELERANRAKARLLAATSHDMAQPLQAQGFFIKALRGYLDRPEQRDLLDQIDAAWRSQKELLDAVVEGARLEGGAIRPRLRSVALDRLVEEVRAVFGAEAVRRGLTLTASGGGLTAWSDPALLARIVRNLASNAVKFTPTGGAVHIEARRGDMDRIVLEVSDTGPGVAQADQDQIFEAFVRLDSSSGDGQGLGLSIVRSLAEALHAPVHFESAPGQGTRAGVTLEPAEAGAAPDPAIPAHLSGAPLILVIDDDEAVRDGLSRLLTEWRCRVISADGAERALTLLRLTGEAPAAAVIDKRLAGGADGLDALEAVRAATGRVLPAVLLTGDVDQFEKAGAGSGIRVLPKPADPDALFALIAQATAEPV